MLEVNKNITLTGISKIDGVQVAYMSATISSDGGAGANVDKNITNQEVYNANKVAVRADIAEFETKVYEVEDELLASKTLEISSVALQVDGEIIAKTINNKKVGK